MRQTALAAIVITATATTAGIIARAWNHNFVPTSEAGTISTISPSSSFNRQSSRSDPGTTNFMASSVRAPRYDQAMAELRTAEATGGLSDPPPPDASAAALRAFGLGWQEKWGPSFEVIVENGQPLLPVGSNAPDWCVTDLDGVPVRVENFRGKHVLLQFGSLSCPTTCFEVSSFESLALKYAEAGVVSVFVYEREAHPESQFGFGVVPQAFSLDDRSRHARRLAALFGLTQPIVIDDMNNATKKAYAAQDNSAYLIDRDGHIVLSQVFFDPDVVDRELATAVGSSVTDIK